MTIILSSSSVIPSFHINLLKSYDLNFKSNSPSNPNFSFVHCNIPQGLPSFNKNINPILKKTLASTLRFIARECMNSNDVLFGEDGSITYDWKDKQGENEDMGSPWEGAVVYQRNPSISHVEYCTTLERLGLGKLSTEVSRSRASVMGLRVTRAVKDFPLGTPVLISVDVTRKKKKLRLDGIVRTVITLACNRCLKGVKKEKEDHPWEAWEKLEKARRKTRMELRCGEPTAKCIFSNFSLLLTEEPVEEPDIINMGVIFGEDKFTTSGSSEEEEDDEASIDLDDRLYFPPEEKGIDISKHIRDMVHVEMTIDALCNTTCQGLCLKCGSNLNTTTCNCNEQETEEKGYGPLGGLKKQMLKN
ncbi:unnamed protein product [Camellia sinensis]